MRKPLHRNGKVWAGTLIALLIMVVILRLAANWTYQKGIASLIDSGNTRLELYINYLQGVLEKYESLPELLAIDDHLVRALMSPHEYKRIETLNKYLETINKVSDTLDTYLMNKDGLTIAASNWQETHPFIGRNFSYRPYFKQAMKGKLGRYFALGTTSSKRGYYFAYPVRKDDEILGAVAIKINIDSVEEHWAHRDENFLVSDPEGVVFITTTPEWRYKTLYKLDHDVLQMIQESRRYPNATLRPLSERVVKMQENTQMLELEWPSDGKMTQALQQSQFMPQAGWQVHILSDIRVVKKTVFLVTIGLASCFVVLAILGILLLQRQQRLAEIKEIEEQAKRSLQEANELLESRVAERTTQLTEANELLRKEIIERRETEVKLKRARKELIHAAKLAVLGQMSAGINHELNQPLAAIRSYTDNGIQYLAQQRMEEVHWNLQQIGELVERMAQIGNQLKLFSKKSSGQIVVVPIHGVVDGALEILKPVLKKSGIDLRISIEPNDLEAKGNHVLLQQVLVNLIGNAAHALEGLPNKKIELSCRAVGDQVLVRVADNGPGVLPEHRQEIFEPFFTTKKSGQGLGLGLTISERIIRDLGGEMRLLESAQGACFEFILSKG